VVGVKKRYGRSTQHVIKVPTDGSDGSGGSYDVVLQRKSSQAKARRGVAFEPLHREF